MAWKQSVGRATLSAVHEGGVAVAMGGLSAPGVEGCVFHSEVLCRQMKGLGLRLWPGVAWVSRPQLRPLGP